MPNTKLLQLAFNGGEVSPEMYGRVDIRDNQAGLRTCKNMYIKPQGAAKKRPGFEYVSGAASNANKSRLIPFQSTPQTVIEVSANTFRFFRNGDGLEGVSTAFFGVATSQLDSATGLFTLNSGSLDGIEENSRVTIYASIQTPGAVYTAWNAGNAIISVIALSGAYTYVGSGSNYIQTSTSHNLRQNDAVALAVASPSLQIRLYYVDVINSTRFRLRVGAQGSATMTEAQHLATLVANTNLYRMLTPSASEFQTAHWYIRKASATTFRLAPSSTGAAITSYWNPGATNHTLLRPYSPGNVVYATPPSATAGRYQHTGAAETWAGPEVTLPWVNYAINNSSPTPWVLVSAGAADAPLGIAHNLGYTDQQLAELTYAQLNNTITIAHRSKPTLILTYTNDQTWAVSQASYSPSLPAPSGVAGTAYGAIKFRFYLVAAANSANRSFDIGLDSVVNGNALSLVPGDTIKCAIYTSLGSAIEDSYRDKCAGRIFTVARTGTVAGGTGRLELKANSQSNYNAQGSYQYYPGELVTLSTAASFPGNNLPDFELWPDDSSSSTQYVVTAIDADGIESQPSAAVTVENNLYARETYNVLTWAQITGAVRYYIYKKQTGLFGYIGQTDASANVSFRDDNITPDLSKAPPILDTSLSAVGAYPGAVAYFEQRKVLAGTTAKPAKIWMTRSNTEQDLSYSLPIKDTDRIAFQVAAKDINIIRHIVSTSELIALTDQAEWRITAVNSDAITPSTVSVRPQSFVGASYVSPVIVNNAVVYEASRGGHVRQLGFNFNAQGYTTTDLSLKAAHLFDDYTLVDMAQMRSPLPILWMPSSNGKLLALTYIPEEQVACWHQHETDGAFESVACIQEGTIDSLYAVVRRTVNNQTVRYIERMTDVRSTGASSNYLDSSVSGSGMHTGTNQLKLSEYGGGGWSVNAVVQIDEISAASVFAATDVDDQLEITLSTGAKLRLVIQQRISGSRILARALQDIPLVGRNTNIATWGFARDVWSGLTHLQGKTVGVIADGSYIGDFTVSAAGSVVLPVFAVLVNIGLKYTSELKTLPAAMQIEAAGQGRTKNVNKVWVRVENQEEFQIGPDADNLVPSGTLSVEETNEELQVTLLPSWSQDGSIVLQQPDPVPLTVNGLAIEVAIGS